MQKLVISAAVKQQNIRVCWFQGMSVFLIKQEHKLMSRPVCPPHEIPSVKSAIVFVCDINKDMMHRMSFFCLCVPAHLI